MLLFEDHPFYSIATRRGLRSNNVVLRLDLIESEYPVIKNPPETSGGFFDTVRAGLDRGLETRYSP